MTETCKFFQLAEVITETGAVNHLFWTFITFSLSLSLEYISKDWSLFASRADILPPPLSRGRVAARARHSSSRINSIVARASVTLS